jgi:hypothetical protein
MRKPVFRPMPVGVAALAVAFLLAGTGVALAFESPLPEKEPLRITKFTMEPTRATHLSLTGGFGNGATVVNDPYEEPFTQAGAHPWALTTTVEFAHEPVSVESPGNIPTQEPKDVVVSLPPGLLGDPMAVPRCSLTDAFGLGECPAASQVGVFRVRWFDGKQYLGPIVDVVPEKGQSAEFAFINEAKASADLTGHLVHTPAGYELTVTSNDVPTVQLYRVETTFWGVPSDPSHDPMRGLECSSALEFGEFTCNEGSGGQHSGVPPVPFLTLSTDCAAGPETATLRADSWEKPGTVNEQKYEGFAEANATLPAVTGCGALAFHPEIALRPTTELADEPVGLDVNLKVPLSEEPETNATPQLRNVLVTLPEGLSVNPGIVDGIQACNEFGKEGINITGPESERTTATGELQLAPGHCPDASIVGSVEAITPLLSEPVRGHVFLARPGCGGAGESPCSEEDALDGNLYRLYLELGGEGELASTGVHFKVEGRTEANPATGQLTTVFEGNPQTPFSELKIHLNEGVRAPLANPAVCGPATTTANFTPWSAPGVTPAPESLFVAGTPDATWTSFYNVDGCANPTPFQPGFTAGTVTPQAGQFSAFTLNLSRNDREQYVKGIQVHTPPGLLGMLSSVPLCAEPAANEGKCLESAKIGTTRVATGAGSHPFEIEGNVYLTGPYAGSPFGLSIVVHVVAGPFNLGTVVVRARIAVDPSNSTLTVTTDETGPHAVPQIVFGVPVRLKRITVDIDRPNFMFNPTNCEAQQIGASVSGSQDATASVSTPFAVGGCKSLGFKPIFKVSTSGRTSRADGASLDAKVSYPAGSFGNDANIARVKVDLPKQLPSRLTTLQKACPAATFEANPASCPAASVVGSVRATTPLLPVGLSGPVYFVSHGGEAFPNLIVVLQGDGVRVDLVGDTFISKAGITSSTFKTVPDVPVETFELYLPEGRYSALAANGNLCKQQSKLKMPTEFVAQNGIVLKQTTKIAVSGCPTSKPGKAHKASRARRAAGARERSGK